MAFSDVTLASQSPRQASPWVLLIQIDPVGCSSLYYARNTEAVTYKTQPYEPMPAEAGSFEMTLTGQLPTLDLVIGKIGSTIGNYIRTYKGFRDAIVTLTVVNVDHLDEDYDAERIIMQVGDSANTIGDITLSLEVPFPTDLRIPPDKYQAWGCPAMFGEAESCGYEPPAIDAMTFPSGAPVQFTQADNTYETGDEVTLSSIVGPAPALDGDYTVTVSGSDILLDDTDGDDYSGVFVSGLAGYAICPKHLSACRQRGRQASYGSQATCRSDSVRIAI